MNGDGYRSRGGDRDRHAATREQYPPRRDDRERDRHRDPDRERRHRSRSPHHRSSRRDPEADSYSSSRGYREREREDRYRDTRDRRDDRGWDRDRGDRAGRGDRGEREDRGPRRVEIKREPDNRPPPRRERDLFDDRRERRPERQPFGGGPPKGGREARQSQSPPPKKKREPTPDLTDTIPILERKRRQTNWDIKPPGYENVTAEQAKLSGMFPLPGAPRQQPMDPTKLQAFMNQPAGTASGAALSPHNAKQSKRLFLYNIPESATEGSIQEFFNLQLNGLNVVSGLDPCITVQIAKDRSFALSEYKSAEDATVVLAMDGISMHDDDAMDTANGDANGAGSGFSIKRPKDYIVPNSVGASAAGEDNDQMGVVNNVVLDNANKISIRNIPEYLNGEQVTELLTSFGDLKAFVLAQDTGTEQSKGFAFCEYADPATTDIAVEGLNDMELGNQHLKVARASIGAAQVGNPNGAMSVGAMSLLAGTTSGDLDQGRVLQLLNMVTPEELMDSEEYAEICQDVKEECEKYGAVEEMKVPRPVVGDRQNPGIGKIYVKYDGPESAQKALKVLAGRKFADRTVVVTFFGEEYFDVNAW